MFFRRKTHQIKKWSLKIFEANYAYAADTISWSENFFRTHDKILLFILILSEKKRRRMQYTIFVTNFADDEFSKEKTLETE